LLKTKMREYRAKMGLNQAQLAEKVGVRRETIGHLERGEYNPSLKLAWDIAKVLGATVDELFTFTEEE
jgi:putative transcriptional regulator